MKKTGSMVKHYQVPMHSDPKNLKPKATDQERHVRIALVSVSYHGADETWYAV